MRTPRLLIGLLLACGLSAGAYADTAGDPRPDPTHSIAPMLEDVLPAVVNISVTGVVDVEPHPLMEDPRFREFFGLEEENGGEHEFQAAGSGVIVDAEQGHILTSAHVLQEAEEIMVTLNDGTQLEASRVGSDPHSDLAVIRIEPPADTQLHTLPWAEPSSVRVGDFVVAVGNPFGLNQTVTTGVISGVGRTGLAPNGFGDFIQTDAAINPGHSGGALVNMKGELVGINAAILSPGMGNIGIGFAIPLSIAEPVLAELAEHGQVRRGRLGIMIEDLTPDLAAELETGADKGAAIAEVEPGTPAAEAGLQRGDVVTGVNGDAIEGAGQLQTRIGLKQPGEEVQLTFDRGGEEMQEVVTLAEMDMEAQAEAMQQHQQQQQQPQPMIPGQ